MTPTEVEAKLAEIRAGLEGVTPGPWKLLGTADCREAWLDQQFGYDAAFPGRDAAHIARLDPATVLSILSYVESLKAERDQAVGAWRDISTAPKDGSEILGVDDENWVTSVHWDTFWGAWYVKGGQRLLATHWRPLPAPPAGGPDAA